MNRSCQNSWYRQNRNSDSHHDRILCTCCSCSKCCVTVNYCSLPSWKGSQDYYPNIQIMVFWGMMQYCNVMRCDGIPVYQRVMLPPFFTLKMEAVWPSEMLITCHNSTWHHNPVDHNLNHHH